MNRRSFFQLVTGFVAGVVAAFQGKEAQAIESKVKSKDYPTGVLYCFPTDQEAEEFSKTRLGPLLSNEHAYCEIYYTTTFGVVCSGRTYELPDSGIDPSLSWAKADSLSLATKKD